VPLKVPPPPELPIVKVLRPSAEFVTTRVVGGAERNAVAVETVHGLAEAAKSNMPWRRRAGLRVVAADLQA
jgi:hypothetical protein